MKSYNEALASNGLGVTGRLSKLQRSAVIIRRHEALGKDHFDDAVIVDYVREISEKLNAGSISKDHASTMFRETERFIQFTKTWEVRLPNPLISAWTMLIPDFQKIVDGFLASEPARVGAKGRSISPNTRNGMRWVAHKYFEWLAAQGFSDLRGTGAQQI